MILLVVIVYFATFFVNGFVSGAVFRQGFFPRVSPGWQRVAFISAGLGPCFLRFHDLWIVIVLVVYCALCAIAVVHRNIPSFPRKTLALLLALFLFVALPLQLAGTVLGRNLRGNPHNPCRITAVPSPVPRAAFYATPRFIALVSGLIPFGSIFIEIFFLFASLWSYKYYYVYGFLAAMTAILKAMSEGQTGGTAFMEDYTYHLVEGQEYSLGAHMLEVCPSVAAEKPRIEVHPLGIGDREPPARLVFEGHAGKAIVVSLIDMGGRLRLICQDIECVKPIMDMPNLPVARVMWRAMPDLTTGLTCWITAGGAHHTVLSYDVTAGQMRDWARMMDIEFVHITRDTTVEGLEHDLFLSDLAWKLK